MTSRTCLSLFLAMALGIHAAPQALAAADSKPVRTVAQKQAVAKKAAAQKKAGAKKAGKSAAKTAIKKAPFDYVGENINFTQWSAVGQFLDEMAAKHGFDRSALESLMGQVHYVDTAVQLMKPSPPGKPKNWQAYSARFIEPIRINAGLEFWNQNAAALARAEQLYGVPAEIIVGIIGVETVYGRNTGNFRVLDALTTLAFDYPETPTRAARMAFFRGELESALLFARQNDIDPLSLLGSYAGAVGLPQFMPSSIMAYAIDFDGNGHIDLRNSASDAIGSVAHFLTEHGWQRDHAAPFVYPVTVAASRAWEPFIGQGLSAKFHREELFAAGVSPAVPLPDGLLFGLVDLQNGSEPTEYWLGGDNFFAITQYNRSYFYAMSVIDLGRAVRARRDL